MNRENCTRAHATNLDARRRDEEEEENERELPWQWSVKNRQTQVSETHMRAVKQRKSTLVDDITRLNTHAIKCEMRRHRHGVAHKHRQAQPALGHATSTVMCPELSEEYTMRSQTRTCTSTWKIKISDNTLET